MRQITLTGKNYVRVNGFRIRDCRKTGMDEPCIIVHTPAGEDIECFDVDIQGVSQMVQSFDEPLQRGPMEANVYLKTWGTVVCTVAG